MDTKSLLYGLIGFFIGGLIVSIAATTLGQEKTSDMSMSDMSAQLQDKKGNEFDQAFITNMIIHHQGAIDMAKLAERNAEHEEIRQLSRNIITAQEKEISEMKQWQTKWGYPTTEQMPAGH